MRLDGFLVLIVGRVVFLAALLSAIGVGAQPVLSEPWVFEDLEPPYELWRIDAGGGKPERFAKTPGYTCGSPDWSPDGKFIAFDTWLVQLTFNDSKIAVIRSDGTELKIIGDGGMPSWSPDGKQIACHTYDNPQTIVVMNADGSGREEIINHWGSPRWSPRGNRIASLGAGRQIYLHDLATGKEQSIFPKRYHSVAQRPSSFHYMSNIGFGISPDGSRYSFGSNDGLFLATLDERTMQCALIWPIKQGDVRHCSWSPDGKRIAFGYTDNGQEFEQIYIFDLETNSAAPLPGLDAKRNNSCPDWSPDGETIIFVSQDPMAKAEMDE
jgi:Tol biopolymer transport system component